MYQIKDPLHYYITENESSVPLEDYTDNLTKYELLRLNNVYTPFVLTKGCLSQKKIDKLINILLKKNKTLKSLNLSNCKVGPNDITDLKKLNNLTSLNLNNSLNWLVLEDDALLLNLFQDLSKLKLTFLDLSNNIFIYNVIKYISIMKTLKILNIKNINLNHSLNISFINFKNLRELDISGNKISIDQLQEISKLENLTLFNCSSCNFNPNPQLLMRTDDIWGYILRVIQSLKKLEYIDVSNILPVGNMGLRHQYAMMIYATHPNIKKINISSIPRGTKSIQDLPKRIKPITEYIPPTTSHHIHDQLVEIIY